MEYDECLNQWKEMIISYYYPDGLIMEEILTKFPKLINYIQNGRTMLHNHHSAIDMINFLVEYGADPNIIDHQGYAALDLALAKRSPPHIIQRLFEVGARIQLNMTRFDETSIPCLPLIFEYGMIDYSIYDYPAVIRWVLKQSHYAVAYELIRLKGDADDYYNTESVLECVLHAISIDKTSIIRFVEGLVFPIRMIKYHDCTNALELLYEFI
jgi:hypothetical protein